MGRTQRDFAPGRTDASTGVLRDDPVSPVIELLVPGRRRVLTARPAVAAVGLLARLGAPRALALWPALERPKFAVDLGAGAAAEWMRASFEARGGGARGRLRALVGAATWSALRARGLLLGRPGGVAFEVAEAALGRPLDRPRLGLFSPSGAPTGKASLFVFEARRRQPSLLVLTMVQPGLDRRLREELEAIERVRELTAAAPEVAAALPLAPLWTGDAAGRFAAGLPIDPLSAHTGAGDRDAALDWLACFQEATAAAGEPVAIDAARELAVVEEAWSILRPDRTAAVTGELARRLEGAAGLRLPPVGVHGDYWRGNIAAAGDRVRVYDWEWWRERDHPLFDPWTLELADVRAVVGAGREALAEALAACLERVEGYGAARGLDPRAALALLPGVLAELAVRGRRVSGRPSPPEIPYAQVMAAAERLLGLS